MLIYSIPDSKPLIYTGSAWETLCTGNISSFTTQEYFVVKNGIPFLPAFSSSPTGMLTSGTIYYSTLSKALMVYNGNSWISMATMLTGTMAASSGFIAGVGVKTVKLPVLSSNPSPAGLVAGAFYINSLSKIIRYYDGSIWQDISCQAIVQTLPITSITGYSATGGGDVTTNGSSLITLTGLCWSTTIDPDTTLTTKTRQVTSGLGIGIFSSPITGLLPLTTYHVRAYAVNSQGVVYGQDRTFTTPIAPPTLITLAANGISSIAAQSGGNISSDGGTSVTSRGIIYSSVSDPLTDFLHAVTNDGSGIGYFTSTLNVLLGNTVYYVRSYAVNSVGSAYGNLVQFTTSQSVLSAMGSDLTISNITGTTATATATVLNNGGALVTGKGVCISTDHLMYNCFPSVTVNPTDVGAFTVDLSGLIQGTTYYVKAYADNSVGRSYSSEISFTTAALSHITTTAPSGVTGTTANSGGDVLDTGYSVITSRGICWDTLPDPTISLLTKTAVTFTGDGTSTFTSGMTGLTAGKTYYVRAYVINTAGVAYGQQEQITMPEFAKVVTLAASSLFNTTATVGGNVTSDGGSAVTERGVCWSTLPTPTYSNLNTSDGDGLGIYMSILTGLSPRSVYHYRAYAKNAVGIAYGEDRTFTIEPDAPTIITLDITGISSFAATSGGNITSNGGAPITRRGIIWSTLGDPVDDPDQFITNDGSGVGEFPSDMKHLLGITTYYVRAYAVNAYGTVYGNLLVFTTLPPILSALNPPTFSGTVNAASTATFLILNNGGALITDRGVCYYSTDPTNKTCVSSSTVNPLDIGTFMVNLQSLVPGTTYYIKAYATNAVGTAYSTETSFKTTSLPVVTTTVPSQIQGRSVSGGGTVFYVGDMTLQARGVVWGTSPNPTIDLATKTSESVTGVGTGIYSSSLNGLTPNTTYYVRAYAINSDGVGYGENLSFLTADYAMVVTTTPHSMTTNYAVLGGQIYSDGNSAVTERGVCYSTSPSPTYSDSHVADPEAAGIGIYVIQPFKNGNMIVGGLRENTKFYVRAYAVNSAGVAYGNLDSMMMQSSQLINYGGSSITITSFTMSGTVNSSGYKDISNKGFVWSTTNPNPTLGDNSSYEGYWAGGIGRNIYNLPTDTKYYYRVYAYTSNGLKYATVDSVNTLPSLLATVTTAHPNTITFSSAVSGGAVSFNGNTAVTERGVCWSISPNPTLSANHTVSGSGNGTFVANMTNLLGSTKYYVRAYAVNTAGVGYGEFDSLVTAPPVLPVVNTTDAINIGSVNAVGRGNVSDAGGATVSETGICWNLTGDPTIADNFSKGGSGIGNFSATMTGLTPVTKYYMRAYAVNKVGMAYGDVISFSTFTLATIVTSSVSDVTNITAAGGGQISSDGGTPVTTSGICWNTTGFPSINDPHTSGNIGIGSFIHSLSGLMGSITYYVRAYATNQAGTAYGQVESFITQPPVIATLTAIPATNGSDGLHVNGGGIIISNGGGYITTEGLVWSTVPSFVPDTVAINRSTIAGSGDFSAVTDRLQPGKTYYIRAYATNSVGTGYSDNVVSITTLDYPMVTTVPPDLSGITSMSVQTGGNITSDGGAQVSENGLCWSIDSPPTISDSIFVNAVGTVNFIHTLSNLFGNITYYVRAYAKNSVGVAYGQLETFTTLPPVLATITTLPAYPTSSTTAEGSGNITTNGGAMVTTRGMVWSTTPAFIPDTVVVNRTATTGYYVGSFSSTITGLQPGTRYYLRAYVENSVGVVYGMEETFTTPAPGLATIITLSPYPTSLTTAAGSGNITNNGGALVITRGVVWSTTPTFIPDTVVVNRTATAGNYIGSFSSPMAGLQAGMWYYVRAYVENSIGVTYGDLTSFKTPTLPSVITNFANPDGPTKGKVGVIITNKGGAPISAKGIVCSTVIGFNPDTVLVNKIPATTTDSIFELALKNLKGGTTYYVMGYATSIAGIGYGNMLSFNTDPAQIATLTTTEATNISWTSITSGGIISDNGGEPITTRGMVWSIIPGFRPDTVVVNRTATTCLDDKQFTSMINALKVNTAYFARAYVANSIGIAYGNEISFITLSVQTLPASAGSDGYTGSGGGNVIGNASTAASITNEGIIWSIAHDPTVALSTKTSISSGSVSTGTFNNEMANLIPATTYYVRAYATTSQGIAYGNEVSFTTPVALPVLTTNVGTPISRSSILTGGKISTNGNGTITAKGIIWSTNPNFNPDTVVVNRTMDGSGSANFASIAIGLTLSTSYYILAYATNSAGTTYGNQVVVSIFPSAPMLNTVDPTAVTGYSITSGGIITMDGGSDITLKGMCWATHSNPTVGDFKTTNGAGSDAFSQGLANLQPNTLYYVRSYAVNSIGTGYGSEKTVLTNGIPTLIATYPVTAIIATKATSGGEITDDGRSSILTRGIVWSIYSNPTIALTTKTLDDTTRTIGSFIAKMSGLQAATIYYVRAYATNGVGTGYGSEATFTTLPVMLPTLTTLAPYAIDSIKATSGGDVTDDGGMPVTTKGLCWGTLPNPTTANNTVVYSVAGLGSYTDPLTGLLPGTKYYVRSFAINIKGKAYGNLDSLTTVAVKAKLTNVVMSNLTDSTGTGSATVLSDGGALVTDRGFVWNKTGNPTLDDNIVQLGTGPGSFADTFNHMVEGPTYYIRAYAINSAGAAYSSAVSSFKICPSSFTVMHYEGLNGAPATKTVTYASVSSNVSGAARCWITQNLGADHQAVSATDGTEASAGWYWQFNRAQGYQYTTSRYPATWVNAINETSDWVKANDPCSLLLGSGWRIPTSTEYTTADGAPQNWANLTNAYNSILKLHAGGYLVNGGMISRGQAGEYWSSTQTNATNGVFLGFDAASCSIGEIANSKSTYGFSLRCIRDSVLVTIPSVSEVTLTGKSKTAITATATATPDGGAPVTARGFCWNTTGNPTMSDNIVAVGNNVGIFIDSIPGLIEGTTYYIRAYATNRIGTVYSAIATEFKVCPPVFTVQHIEGIDGAPVSKTVTYHSVSSTISGKAVCWITQNLGADHEAVSPTDATETSAGWYWQFNRVQGYQYTTVRYPSPWVSAINENSNWIPANDPCLMLLGTGWRIPINSEWTTAKGVPQNWANYNDTYNSILKLHNAGFFDRSSGILVNRGIQGDYWSSTQINNTDAYYTYFAVSSFAISGVDANSKSRYAFSLRCLRDTMVISVPTVRNVTLSDITSSSAGVLAIVTHDGGSPVKERGFCWNTTGNPTVACSKVIDGSTGTGTFSANLSGLTPGTTYYVRAYATNSMGTGYGLVVDSFITNLPLSVSSIMPSTGPTAGGTNVTIMGTNFILPNSGGDAGWATVSGKTLPGSLYGSRQAVIGDKIYLFGGYNGSAYVNVIYSAPVSDPTTWSNTGKTLPGNLYGSQLAVVGSKIYLFGGHNGTAVTNVIYTASVSDPTTWTVVSGKTLPGNLYLSQLAVVNNSLYLFGGSNGTVATNVIYTASVSDPTTWTIVPGKTLPGNLYGSQVASIGNNLYLFGGYNGSSYTKVIYTAPVSDPITWVNIGKTLPVTNANAQLVTIGDSLYLLGGYNGSAIVSSIFIASITDPTTWTTSASVLPATLYVSSVAVIDNYAYLFGGLTTTATSTIYRTPLTHKRPNVYNKFWLTNWKTIASDQSNITIGGNPVTNINFSNSTTITATTPAHLIGATDVVVTNYDGQSATLTNGFTYLPPAISSISPNYGSTLGGTTVTITGSNFVGSDSGTGLDGSITIAANKNLNTDAIATGRTSADAINYSVTTLTANTATLSAVPAAGSLAVGDEVLLINLQGITTNYANVGNYETLKIQSISSNVVTFTINKTKYYGNNITDDTNIGIATINQRVMLQRVPSYTNVTINSGITLTADAWDGTKGGVLYLKASGTVINNGTINMSGKGYRGGVWCGGTSSGCTGQQGESLNGLGGVSVAANGGGAGGGYYNGTSNGVGFGGNAGYATAGTITTGEYNYSTKGAAGLSYGISSLGKIYLGSGGGGAAYYNYTGGYGGGIVAISANIFNTSGSVNANGVNAVSAYAGVGSGGSILFNVTNSSLGFNLVSANSGGGGVGRVAILYKNSISGSSAPDAYSQQIFGGSSIRVSFGGTVVYGTVVNSTTIVVTTPANTAGAADVIVTNSDGQSATFTNGYTYILPPTVSSITPATSMKNGGDVVTISGSDFVGTPTVKFGGTNATSVSRVDANTLSVVVPAHVLGTFDVVVINPDSQSATLANAFMFIELPPTISSVTPNNGSTYGGTNVTITGTNFILPNSGGNAGWSTVSGKTLPSAFYGASQAVVGDKIYFFGGNNGSTATNIIYSASVSDPTTWINTGKTLPGNLYYSQLAIVGNSLYLFGGNNGTAVTNVIYTASTSDPTTWTVVPGKTLPGNLYLSHSATVGNNLYLFGGQNGTAVTNVIYTASVSNPTTWSIVSGKTLPGNLYGSQVATIGNNLYLFGGYNGSAYTNVIYTAPVSDPTTWTNTGRTLPVTNAHAQLITIGDYLYLLGGFNGSTNVTSILSASISDPTTWTTSTNILPVAIDVSSIAVIDNYAYLFGGYATTAMSAIYRAPLTYNRPNVYNIPWLTNWRTIASDQSNVTIGGNPATTINFSNSTSITATTPAHTVGATDVVVTNYDGQSATLTNGFTYLPPSISSISPNNGPYYGGTNVTISGTNFILPNSGGDTGWATVSGKTLPGALYGSQQAVVGDKIYLFGGCNGSVYVNAIFSTSVSDPTTWSNTGKTLPGNLYGSQLAVVGTKMYLFGGFNGTAATNVIYTALTSDPTTWTVVPGKTLPGNLYSSQLAVINNSLYLFGGENAGAATNVIYTALVSDPTTWTTVFAKTLPGTLYGSQVATIGNNLYLFGGYNASAYSNAIYTAPVSDPTTWTNTGRTLPATNAYAQLVTIGDYLYLLGGYNGSASVSSIFRASISDPTTWTTSTNTLPAALYVSSVAVIDNYAYLFGGYTTAATSAIYRAPLTHNRPNAYNIPWLTNWRTIAIDQSNVTIGGNSATNINFSNSTTITAITPEHLVGATDVVFTNYDGQSATLTNGFTYLPLTVSSISPNNGSTAGGTNVTITGTNFIGSDFGTGLDGSITIAANKNINTDAIATGRTYADAINYSVTALTTNTATLSAVPAAGSLAIGDEILLINLQGITTNYANVGNYETLKIQSISSNVITFATNKTKFYGNNTTDDANIGIAITNQRVMLQRVPYYADVTINSGITLTANAWDGTKGGVLYFKTSGTMTNNGTINMIGKGYRGGGAYVKGESYAGVNLAGFGGGSNGVGGTGGNCVIGAGGGGGGGGAYGANGVTGQAGPGGGGGAGGASFGASDLGKMFFGGAGGGGGYGACGGGGSGGNAGGIIAITANSFANSNVIQANGLTGTAYIGGGGGAGSGGSIRISGNIVTLGNNTVTASGAVGSPDGGWDGGSAAGDGGASSVGRVAIFYKKSISGSSAPGAYSKQISLGGESISVSFGGSVVYGTVVNSSTIVLTTPAYTAGGTDVIVTNSDGQSATLTNGYTYW